MRLHVRDLGSGLCKAAGFLMVLTALSGLAMADTPLPGLAPEIDPGSIAGALTLLSGGLLMLTDRRRREISLQVGAGPDRTRAGPTPRRRSTSHATWSDDRVSLPR